MMFLARGAKWGRPGRAGWTGLPVEIADATEAAARAAGEAARRPKAMEPARRPLLPKNWRRVRRRWWSRRGFMVFLFGLVCNSPASSHWLLPLTLTLSRKGRGDTRDRREDTPAL